jgi:hypothetical protein
MAIPANSAAVLTRSLVLIGRSSLVYPFPRAPSDPATGKRRGYCDGLRRSTLGLAYGSLPSGSASIHRQCSASAALSTAQASPWRSRYCAMRRTPRQPAHFRMDVRPPRRTACSIIADGQMPGGLEGAGRLFSFHASGRLRDLLKMTVAEAGVVLPRRVAFHVFCHTWATWMRQHGGLDTFDLVRTPQVGRPRIGRPLCARRRERAGPPGRPVAGRQKEGGVIRGKSVDNRKSAATSRRILPFTRERS